MTKIYLVRHAEAEGNLYRVVHGQYNSIITPRGYRQLACLRQRFLDIPLDAVYCSDLFRTTVTATALSVPKGLTLRLLPLLKSDQRRFQAHLRRNAVRGGIPRNQKIFAERS